MKLTLELDVTAEDVGLSPSASDEKIAVEYLIMLQSGDVSSLDATQTARIVSPKETRMSNRPTVYRYEVPVDDEWHELELSGQVLHVAAKSPEVVEFWATAYTEAPRKRRFCVYGTGQPLPDGLAPTRWTPHWESPTGLYHGSGIVEVPSGRLVWHLFELTKYWQP